MRPACHLDIQNTVFETVWTPKGLGQDLLMMTILEDSACSVTPTIQTKQLLA